CRGASAARWGAASALRPPLGSLTSLAARRRRVQPTIPHPAVESATAIRRGPPIALRPIVSRDGHRYRARGTSSRCGAPSLTSTSDVGLFLRYHSGLYD